MDSGPDTQDDCDDAGLIDGPRPTHRRVRMPDGLSCAVLAVDDDHRCF